MNPSQRIIKINSDMVRNPLINKAIENKKRTNERRKASWQGKV